MPLLTSRQNEESSSSWNPVLRLLKVPGISTWPNNCMRRLLVTKLQSPCSWKLRGYSVRTTELGENFHTTRVPTKHSALQVILSSFITSPGKPVKLNARRLRAQYLPNGSASYHARVTVDGNFAGSLFACRWKHVDKSVCWVTQLVVDRNYRERGLATSLLRSLRSSNTDDIYGIMSSHPVACLATVSAFGGKFTNISSGDEGTNY